MILGWRLDSELGGLNTSLAPSRPSHPTNLNTACDSTKNLFLYQREDQLDSPNIRECKFGLSLCMVKFLALHWLYVLLSIIKSKNIIRLQMIPKSQPTQLALLLIVAIKQCVSKVS